MRKHPHGFGLFWILLWVSSGIHEWLVQFNYFV